MGKQAKPLLSIGIIFKNEIRCLERCLKSLQPLRDRIPCELVMADTGATDGSRAVAEKYADRLIDFEWINDFAAARNAVMNQCSGKWYMSIDCDEWLGGDLSKLISFLKTDETCIIGAVVVRNYSSPGLEKDGEYNDFNAQRLLRMSTGLRFEGAIHEHWHVKGSVDVRLFTDVLFHHDGYLYMDPVVTREKHERNMVLLRKKLEDNPGDLTTLLQCIESADGTHDVDEYLKQSIQGVKEKRIGWNLLGGAILRYAVITDYRRELPELEEHIQMAEEMLPDSIYTRIDIQFAAFGKAWQESRYKECILRGERYLKALADYHLGNYNRFETMCSTLLLGSPRWRIQLQLFLAGSYLYEGQAEKGFAILPKLDGSQMTVGNVNSAVQIYAHFHARSALDTAPLIQQLWEQINRPVPDEERGNQRRNEFIRVGADYFRRNYQNQEASRDDFRRHAYTIFSPIAGECPLGDAAVIMEKTNVIELEQLLSKIENWEVLPISALAHALNCGVNFPLRDKPMKMEELDSLAGRLSQDEEHIRPLIERIAENTVPSEVQTLSWVRGLTLAALYIVNWKDESQTEWAMAVIRAFAKTEQAFLSRCYAEEMLCDENIAVLPPMHRFGWYLARAFQALNSGDAVGYARMLREGLSSYENMKPAVEFLLKHTSELQVIPEPSEELRAIADQVRTILAAYPPDDPAVAVLKQSEAYQKVAYLIEGVEPPIMGGQVQ